MALPKATLLIGAPIVDAPWDPVYAVIDDGTIGPASATEFAVTDSYGNKVVFTGSFTVAGGVVTGGTVTGFTASLGPTATVTGSGYAIAATALVDAIKDAIDNGNQEGFWDLVWNRPLDMVGSALDDYIRGNDFGGSILGGAGNDQLWGGPGNEIVKGGAGDDVIGGGRGFDQLFGGTGKDAFFVFDTANVDVIKDFSPKDDLIELDLVAFDELGPGFVSKSEFGIGKMAATADQHLIYDKTSGALYYDADGAGGAAQVKILQLAKGLALTAHDFALFDTFVK